MDKTRVPMAVAISLLLFVTAVVISFMTRSLSEDVQERTARAPANVTPSPPEQSIYLDLPKSFPRDMPLITKAKVTTSSETESDWTATFLTTESLTTALEFYEREIVKNGWHIEYKSEASGLTIFYVNKGQRDGIISIGRGDLGITVSITILKQS